MKRFPKILMALLVLALFVGMFSTVTFANQLKGVNLTVSQLQVGYYTNLSGDLTLHCANSDIDKETKNLVDNKSKPFYWSKPYRFDDLKAYGGNIVPAILIDVANGGDGVAICGYSMQLREYLDCVPYSFEIQATLSAGSNDWTKIFADSDTSGKWAGDAYSCEFAEVTVYKVRILFYDIGDPDYAKDDAYGTLPPDSTRFSLSEINLFADRDTATTPTEAPTEIPTEAPTRPAFTRPVTPTEEPTQAPTEAPTAAPTQAPTELPTAVPTEAPTAAPTEAPTAAPTEAATAAPTEAPTAAPTVMPTETPTAAPTEAAPTEPVAQPTEPTAAATQAPTVGTTAETQPVQTAPATEPEAQTTEPTGLITTVPATGPATVPEDSESVSNVGGADAPDDADNTTLIIIIVAIVAFAALAGTLVFFVIKKKRAQ